MKISVYINKYNPHVKVAQIFHKGKMVTVENLFGNYIMTKGNLIYGKGFKDIPKSLQKVYDDLVNAIEATTIK